MRRENLQLAKLYSNHFNLLNCMPQFDRLTADAGLLKVETVGPVYVVRPH